MNERNKRAKISDAMGPEQIFLQAMTLISPVTYVGRALIPGNTPLDSWTCMSLTELLGTVMGLMPTSAQKGTFG